MTPNPNAHPYSSAATPAERRQVRLRIAAFYAANDPQKPTQEVGDLVEWTLDNGAAELNGKLIKKYGVSLDDYPVESFESLPLLAQLKLFYLQFDPKRSTKEIVLVENWAKMHGVQLLNAKQLTKYGENLHSLSFGNKKELRTLLEAFYERHDAKKNNKDNLSVVIDWACKNGAAKLQEKLKSRYGNGLDLSVDEIRAAPRGTPATRDRADSNFADALSASDSRKLANQQGSHISLGSMGSSASSPYKGARANEAVNKVITSTATTNRSSIRHVRNVAENEHLRTIVELFYAKHNPRKLASGIDEIVEFAAKTTDGVAELNDKMIATYGEGINSIEGQYTQLLAALEAFYKKHDPKRIKKGLEDLASWAVVHGIRALDERLAKKFGEGLVGASSDSESADMVRRRVTQFYELYEPGKDALQIEMILDWIATNSLRELNEKLKRKFGYNLDDLPPFEVGEDVLDASGVVGGASTSKTASPEPSRVVLAADASSTAPNAATTVVGEDLSELQRAASKSVASESEANNDDENAVEPENLAAPTEEEKVEAERVASVRKSIRVSVRATQQEKTGRTESDAAVAPEPLGGIPILNDARAHYATLEKEVSFADKGGSDGDDDDLSHVGEEMKNFKHISRSIIGVADLPLRLHAFYLKHDPDKADDTASMDTLMRWTLRHGVEDLNEKLLQKYGESLYDVDITEETKMEDKRKSMKVGLDV